MNNKIMFSLFENAKAQNKKWVLSLDELADKTMHSEKLKITRKFMLNAKRLKTGWKNYKTGKTMILKRSRPWRNLRD